MAGLKESKVKCEIRWCGQEDNEPVYVNENIGDGSWRTAICRKCAGKLGLREGDDLPEPHVVKRAIR